MSAAGAAISAAHLPAIVHRTLLFDALHDDVHAYYGQRQRKFVWQSTSGPSYFDNTPSCLCFALRISANVLFFNS
jgi:hypothetical protein